MKSTFMKTGIGALVALAVVFGSWFVRQQAARHRAELAVVQIEADSAAARAARMVLIVDSVVKAADARQVRVDTVVKTVRIRFDSAAAAAPDTCLPVIEAGRVALDSMQSLLAEQRGISVDLRAALLATRDTLTATRLSLIKLQGAADKASGKRSFLAALVPEPWFGLQAGISTEQKPYAGVGIGLGWSF